MECGQFEYDGLKSYDDFGFVIKDLYIGMPQPNLILESVPYMQGVYDFSSVGGETKYTTREIQITLQLDRYEYFIKNIVYFNLKVVNWLNNVQTMQELKIDYIQGTFLARVEEIGELQVTEDTIELSVKFKAQPFRTWDLYEGHNIWDEMNFDSDWFQEVKFTTLDDEYKTEIELNNISVTKAKPIINVTGNVTLEYGGFIYTFTKGQYINTIRLEKGINKLKIYGYGTIEFLWRKELI